MNNPSYSSNFPSVNIFTSNNLTTHSKSLHNISHFIQQRAQEGHDPMNFTSPVNSDLLCCICNLVVRKPRECVICGNMFCDYCIRAWAEKNNKLSYNLQNTITNNKDINNSKLSNNYDFSNYIITECPMKCKSNYNIKESLLKPVGKVVKNLLYQLEIKCPNTCCGNVFTLDKYEEHEFYCFLPKCQNTLCGKGSDKQVTVSI